MSESTRSPLRAGVLAAAGTLSLLTMQACADTYAREGAKAGLVGGAVAGAVGSLFWGGNVVGNMAAGAITTAAAGAAVGAMSEKPATQSENAGAKQSSSEAQGKDVPPREELVKREREVEARIGPANFEAARLLARCDHNGAITQAQKAFAAEQTQERRAYALMIEAIAAEEVGNTDKAASVYPRLVQVDPSRESVVKARNDALSGILKVQQVRKQYGAPATCG
jgi:hypothetical protein